MDWQRLAALDRGCGQGPRRGEGFAGGFHQREGKAPHFPTLVADCTARRSDAASDQPRRGFYVIGPPQFLS